MSRAGIQSSHMMADRGVQFILTGNIGPNAFQTLSVLGIKVYTGASGKVKEVIQQFKEGKFNEMSGPSVPGHFGTGGK